MASLISSGLVRGGGNTSRWLQSQQQVIVKDIDPELLKDLKPGGIIVTHNSVNSDPTETLLVPDSRALGFTGNTCSKCLGTHMLQTGHCETCQDCGETSACA